MADFNTEIEQMKAESLKQLEKDIAAKSVKPLEEDVVLQKYSERLNELRKDGVHKIIEGKQNIAVAKRYPPKSISTSVSAGPLPDKNCKHSSTDATNTP